jgi:hypothetical protein
MGQALYSKNPQALQERPVPGVERNSMSGAAILLLGGLLLGGCTSAPTRVEVDNSMANLLAIHTAYTDFVADSGKPPRTQKDLEWAFPEHSREALDELFRSPHDGQPYVIVWGIMLRPPQPAPPVVLAYEKDGDCSPMARCA